MGIKTNLISSSLEQTGTDQISVSVPRGFPFQSTLPAAAYFFFVLKAENIAKAVAVRPENSDKYCNQIWQASLRQIVGV